jgi:hypothetical protein
VRCHTGDARPQPDADISGYPLRLNPEHGGLAVYMGGSEGCHNVPANVDVAGLMEAINETEPASCALLSDPAWRECPFGAVYAKPDATACVCRTTGAAPKPMRCPAR